MQEKNGPLILSYCKFLKKHLVSTAIEKSQTADFFSSLKSSGELNIYPPSGKPCPALATSTN